MASSMDGQDSQATPQLIHRATLAARSRTGPRQSVLYYEPTGCTILAHRSEAVAHELLHKLSRDATQLAQLKRKQQRK
jgi:hypothetical protein